MSRRRKSGFTLIELVMTVGVVLLVFAISMPLFGPIIAQRRLAGALTRIASDIRYVQSLAVKEGNLYRILTDGAGRYRLERNAGGWTQVSGWYNISANYDGSTLQSVQDNGGGALANITFNSLGVVDAASTGAVSYPIRLTVSTNRGATGTVEVLRTGVVRIP